MTAAQKPEGLLLSKKGCTLGGAGRGRGKADDSLAGEWELQEWGRDGVWSQDAPRRDALFSSASFSSFTWGRVCAGSGYLQEILCLQSAKSPDDLCMFLTLKCNSLVFLC